MAQYQIYDTVEEEYKEDTYTFEEAQELIASHWEDDECDTYDEIMECECPERLAEHAEGLGWTLEHAI